VNQNSLKTRIKDNHCSVSNHNTAVWSAGGVDLWVTQYLEHKRTRTIMTTKGKETIIIAITIIIQTI